MRQYTTIQGDTWDLIAYKMYGNEYKMQKLIASNSEYIDVAIFSAGIVLDVPEITADVSLVLPPWKR